MTKAISTVVITVMLLMITFAMIGIFYMFSSGSMTSCTSAAGYYKINPISYIEFYGLEQKDVGLLNKEIIISINGSFDRNITRNFKCRNDYNDKQSKCYCNFVYENVSLLTFPENEGNKVLFSETNYNSSFLRNYTLKLTSTGEWRFKTKRYLFFNCTTIFFEVENKTNNIQIISIKNVIEDEQHEKDEDTIIVLDETKLKEQNWNKEKYMLPWLAGEFLLPAVISFIVSLATVIISGYYLQKYQMKKQKKE